MLEGSLKEKKATNDQVKKLQMELSSVEKNLEEIRNKHDSSTKELARELAKGKSSAKHSKVRGLHFDVQTYHTCIETTHLCIIKSNICYCITICKLPVVSGT